MARESFVWSGGTFVPAERFYAAKWRDSARKRSSLPAPSYISDSLGDGLLNHADGRIYTSKAKYVRAVKDAGCEIVGNEKIKRPQKKKATISDDLRREVRERTRALVGGQKKVKLTWTK